MITLQAKLLATLAIRIIGAVSTFVSIIVFARLLGPSQFGQISTVLSVCVVLGIPFQAGLPLLITRLVSANRTGLPARDSASVLVLIAFYCPVFILLSYLLLRFLGLNNTVEDLAELAWLLGLFLASTASLIMTSVVRGRKKIVLASLPEHLVKPVALMLCALAMETYHIAVFPTPNMLINVLVVYVFASSLAAIVAFQICVAGWPETSVSHPSEVVERFNKTAWWTLTIYAGAQVLYLQLDVLVASWLLTDSDVGTLKAAAQFASILLVGLSVINQGLQPFISEQYRTGQASSLQQVALRGAQLSLAITTPPAIAMFIWAPDLFEVVFGPGYEGGLTVFRLLLVGHFLNIAFGPVGVLLNMTGHEKLSMRYLAISMATYFILLIPLVKNFGLMGVGMALIVSTIFWNHALRVCVKKVLGIEPSAVAIFAQRILLRSSGGN